MKRMCVLAGLVCFLCSGVLAASTSFRGVGNWIDPDAWDNGVPTGAIEVKVRGADTFCTLSTSTGDWGVGQRMRVYEGATLLIEDGADLLGAGWMRVGAGDPGYVEQSGGTVVLQDGKDDARLGIGDEDGSDGHYAISGGTLTYAQGSEGHLLVGARAGKGRLTIVGSEPVILMAELTVADQAGGSGTIEFQMDANGVSPIILDVGASIDPEGEESVAALMIASAGAAPEADVLLIDQPEGADAANAFDSVNGEPAVEGAAVAVQGSSGVCNYTLTYAGGDTANDIVLLYDSFVPAPKIIWVSDNIKYDFEADEPADAGFVNLLRAQGYEVSYRGEEWPYDPDDDEVVLNPDWQYWWDLDPNKVEELNAADLVIISRIASSGKYDDVVDGFSEPNEWNGVTTPMISLNAHISRNSKWKWANGNETYSKDVLADIVAPDHVVFDGVEIDPNGQALLLTDEYNVNVIGVADAGNGTLLAARASDGSLAIATWEAGVEFYEGSGQIAGGPRMFFAAGSGSKSPKDGLYNLTADGELAFLNAVNYMLKKNIEIVWVSDNLGYDFDAGRPADQGFVDLLTALGYTVDYKGQFDPHEPGNDEVPVNPEWTYWRELDPNKIAELNAADLVIIARDCASGCYDDGNEPLEWNSITTPMLMQSGHLARTGKWSWLNTGSTTRSKDPNAVVVDALHPLYDGVSVAANGQVAVQSDEWNVDWANSTDVGNGALLAARPDGVVWIATWQAGQEYFEGSGQVAGGPRMLFISGSGGSNPIEDGTNNLTIDGELMFLNAVVYMLGN